MSSFEETGSPLEKAAKDKNLTEFDHKVFESISKALWLPNEFKEYMVQYFALNQPPISIAQVFGFTQFTAQYVAGIDTTSTETTTSTTFTDLATPGPSVAGLPDGQYLIMFGANMKNSVGGAHTIMSVQVNATTATNADSIDTEASVFVPGAKAIVKELKTGGNNTVACKFRVGSDTGSFNGTWIFVFKYANA